MAEKRFKNSWARTERAAMHLIAFKSEWERVFSDNGITTVARYDEDSGWRIAAMSVPAAMRERLDRNTLALELGEYAYQLRAALDGLIWDAMTLTQGTEPATNTNRVEFPVVDGITREFKDCGFMKFPFPDQLKTWLESIQPGAAEKPEGDPDRGLSTALSDIHNLARFDRHRRLRIIAAVITHLRFGIVSDPKGQIVARERIDSFDLFGGQYEFLRFKVETADRTDLRHLALKTEIAFEALLEDIRPFPGMDAGSQLGSYISAVQYIVSMFEKAFT